MSPALSTIPEMTALPGADLVELGVRELGARRETVASLLVSTGATRLRALGVEVAEPFVDPESRLYALLSRTEPDSAHARYNALLRRLVSYERAAECVAP